MKPELHETPKQRLLRIARYSLPFRRSASGPSYLVAVGLLLMIAAILLAAILAGVAVMEIFRAYTP